MYFYSSLCDVIARGGSGVQMWESNRDIAHGFKRATKDCIHITDQILKIVSIMLSSTRHEELKSLQDIHDIYCASGV